MKDREQTVFSDIALALNKTFTTSLIMLSIACLLGYLFFYVEQVRFLFDWMAVRKMQYGLLYGVVSTAVFGGLIPFCVLVANKTIRHKFAQNLAFYLFLWALMGLLVDAFYQLQGNWFGYDNTLAVLVKKVLLDQFVFSAFLTCPLLTVSFMWRNYEFSFSTTMNQIDRSLFTRSIPKTVVTNWIIWLPAVCLIYSMPQSLQISFFNLILCLFVLILTALNLDE